MPHGFIIRVLFKDFSQHGKTRYLQKSRRIKTVGVSSSLTVYLLSPTAGHVQLKQFISDDLTHTVSVFMPALLL